jgi:anoctamin-10
VCTGVYGKIATLIGLETWAYTGGLPEAGYGWSWSWTYAAIVGIWGIAVTEGWRIKERKLSVQFGTFRVTKVSRLRAQYLRSLPGTYGGAAPSITAIDALNASHSVSGDPTFIAREAKILASVPVIIGLGLVLGALLTSIFIFEAFLSKLYDGPGKSALVSRHRRPRLVVCLCSGADSLKLRSQGLIPTLMFVGVVPNVLALYHSISARLTNWENHPTKSSHTASLTVKTLYVSECL